MARDRDEDEEHDIFDPDKHINRMQQMQQNNQCSMLHDEKLKQIRKDLSDLKDKVERIETKKIEEIIEKMHTLDKTIVKYIAYATVIAFLASMVLKRVIEKLF